MVGIANVGEHAQAWHSGGHSSRSSVGLSAGASFAPPAQQSSSVSDVVDAIADVIPDALSVRMMIRRARRGRTCNLLYSLGARARATRHRSATFRLSRRKHEPEQKQTKVGEEDILHAARLNFGLENIKDIVK